MGNYYNRKFGRNRNYFIEMCYNRNEIEVRVRHDLEVSSDYKKAKF